MIRLLLYILLFLIGVLLYYIKSNNNIEKFNISSTSLLFQRNQQYNEYKARIQTQYDSKKTCKRIVYVNKNRRDILRTFRVDCDVVMYMTYKRINTHTNPNIQSIRGITYPIATDFIFGIGIKKITSRQTRSCARPSTQYKFMFIGDPPSLLDENTGLPSIDRMLTGSPEKYFVNMHDTDTYLAKTTISLAQSTTVATEVATVFQRIIDNPQLRPPEGIPHTTRTIFDDAEEGLDDISIPQTESQDSQIYIVARLVADYARLRIDIGLNRKKLFSPYNLWGLLEKNMGVVCTQDEYTDVEDFKILDPVGNYSIAERHRISETQKFLFHNGLLLKNSYGGSLITKEFREQLQINLESSSNRVNHTFNSLNMENKKYHISELLCCFSERLLPCSRQTVLCKFEYSLANNLSREPIYQNIYSPFKLTQVEQQQLNPYDQVGTNKHFTSDIIHESETNPIPGVSIDYLEWLEFTKNMEKNLADSDEIPYPSIEYTDGDTSDRLFKRLDEFYYYISGKSPENINYLYGFILCAVPKLFSVVESLNQGTELHETNFRGTHEAAITIQRYARGRLTRIRTDDECASGQFQNIPSFIIEHCGNDLNFFIE